jgi:hypothetical protein
MTSPRTCGISQHRGIDGDSAAAFGPRCGRAETQNHARGLVPPIVPAKGRGPRCSWAVRRRGQPNRARHRVTIDRSSPFRGYVLFIEAFPISNVFSNIGMAKRARAGPRSPVPPVRRPPPRSLTAGSARSRRITPDATLRREKIGGIQPAV